jgi:hypothetical protein
MKTYTLQEIQEQLASGKSPAELIEEARAYEEEQARIIENRNKTVAILKEMLPLIERGDYDNSDMAEVFAKLFEKKDNSDIIEAWQ